MIELDIKIKDEYTTLCEKELIFDPLLLDPESEILKKKVAAVMQKFKAQEGASSPDVIIKAKLTW